MKILTIIVTYNGASWIRKCIHSLLESSKQTDILVVDNKSQDETVAILKEEFPSIYLIETGENLGFGRANNVGLKKAIVEGYNYAFLLNQDAWVDKLTISTLILVAEANENFGVISPMHYSGDGTELEYKFKEYISVDVCPGLISDKFMDNVKELYSTEFVNAAAWLISRECILKVGGFDPLYPHYGEDVDFTQRVKFYGYKVGICPATNIWHDSKIQAWDDIKWNEKRMLTIYCSEVKDINGSLRSNLLIFCKRRFDELTSLFLYRKFKEFYFKSKLLSKLIFRIHRIKKARRKTLITQAFLADKI